VRQKIGNHIASLSVSRNTTGLTITERVVYITYGSITAAIASGAAWGGNNKFIVASYSLSMATNGVATALIAYRAWSVFSHCFCILSNPETGYFIKLCSWLSLSVEAKSAVS
jgi:hypothetical protein